MKKINEYAIEFYGRKKEIDQLLSTLNAGIKQNYFLHGKSGTGKTKLISKVIEKYHKDNPDVPIIYFDSLLGYDNENSNIFPEYFSISKLLIASEFDYTDMTCLKREHTLEFFLKKNDIHKRIINLTVNALKAALGFIPHGSTINSVIDNISPAYQANKLGYNYSFVNILKSYIEKVFSDLTPIVIIDNIQELHEYELMVLAEIFSSKAINIQIYREKANQTLIDYDISKSSYCSNNIQILEISTFNKSDIHNILSLNIAEFSKNTTEYKKKIVEDCMNITGGLPIDVARYVVKYKKNRSLSLSNFNEERVSLDLIAKQLLFIMSQFKSGLKNVYVYEIFHDFLSQNISVELAIDELIERGMIDVNKYQSGLIAPSHESVLRISEDILINEDNEAIFDIIPHINYILIKNATIENEEFLFLVKSLLSLNKLEQLRKEMYLIYRYLRVLDEFNYFSEIVRFYKENIEFDGQEDYLFEFLPLNTTKIILNAFQKTGEFTLGLTLIKKLSRNDMTITYNAKYLIQLYKYDEALKLLDQNLDSFENYTLKVNILQHLRRDYEVKSLIENIHSSNHKDEFYYLLLRNTGHLFNPELSISNITKCISYFPQNSFYQGTAYNNLGIQKLRSKRYHEALSIFNKAENIFIQLNSNEIYQVYFNKSVYYLLISDITKAVEYLKSGFKSVPKTLIYDINKFICNFIYAKYLQDNNLSLLNHRLKSYYNRIKKSTIPDKWLYFQAAYNLISTSKALGLEVPHEYLEIITNFKSLSINYGQTISFNGFDYILAISPHWRF